MFRRPKKVSKCSLLIFPHVQVNILSATSRLPISFPTHPPRLPTKQRKQKRRAGSLQGIGKEFVHLCDAGRDAEINRAVADLNDEATEDLGVDLFTSLAFTSFLTRGNRMGGRRKGGV